jgi:hypothetical protein
MQKTPERICCHTFRATGISTYLENGDTIDVGQPKCLLRQFYPGFLSAVLPMTRRLAPHHSSPKATGVNVSRYPE